MLIFIEIALTIWAWNRGWKAKALIPIGVAFGIGVLIGLSGGATSEFMSIAVIFDIIAMVALGFMIGNPPSPDNHEGN
jgi:hypothetical protein